MAKDKEKNRFYKNKTTLTVYLILRGVIIFVMVRAVFRQLIRYTPAASRCGGWTGSHWRSSGGRPPPESGRT